MSYNTVDSLKEGSETANVSQVALQLPTPGVEIAAPTPLFEYKFGEGLTRQKAFQDCWNVNKTLCLEQPITYAQSFISEFEDLRWFERGFEIGHHFAQYERFVVHGGIVFLCASSYMIVYGPRLPRSTLIDIFLCLNLAYICCCAEIHNSLMHALNGNIDVAEKRKKTRLPDGTLVDKVPEHDDIVLPDNMSFRDFKSIATSMYLTRNHISPICGKKLNECSICFAMKAKCYSSSFGKTQLMRDEIEKIRLWTATEKAQESYISYLRSNGMDYQMDPEKKAEATIASALGRQRFPSGKKKTRTSSYVIPIKGNSHHGKKKKKQIKGKRSQLRDIKEQKMDFQSFDYGMFLAWLIAIYKKDWLSMTCFALSMFHNKLGEAYEWFLSFFKQSAPEATAEAESVEMDRQAEAPSVLSALFAKIAEHCKLLKLAILPVLYMVGFSPDKMLVFNNTFGNILSSCLVVTSLSSFVSSVLDTVEGFIPFFLTGDLSKCRISSPIVNFAREVNHYHDLCHSPAWNDTKESMFLTYDALKRKGEILSSTNKESSSEIIKLNNLLFSAWNHYKMTLEAGEPKMTPLGIAIVGKPQIGKSFIVTSLEDVWAKVRGIEGGINAASHVFNMPPSSKFMDGYNSQPIVVLDDWGAVNPDIIGAPAMPIQNLISPVTVQTPQAEATEKGRHPLRAELVLATTNHENYNLGNIYTVPQSVYRRFVYRITMIVNDKYVLRSGTSRVFETETSLDPDKTKPGDDDVHTFKIEKWAGVAYVQKHEFTSTRKFLDWFEDVLRTWINREKKNVFVACPHGMRIKSHCKECYPNEQPPLDSVQEEAPYDVENPDKVRPPDDYTIMDPQMFSFFSKLSSIVHKVDARIEPVADAVESTMESHRRATDEIYHLASLPKRASRKVKVAVEQTNSFLLEKFAEKKASLKAFFSPCECDACSAALAKHLVTLAAGLPSSYNRPLALTCQATAYSAKCSSFVRAWLPQMGGLAVTAGVALLLRTLYSNMGVIRMVAQAMFAVIPNQTEVQVKPLNGVSSFGLGPSSTDVIEAINSSIGIFTTSKGIVRGLHIGGGFVLTVSHSVDRGDCASFQKELDHQTIVGPHNLYKFNKKDLCLVYFDNMSGNKPHLSWFFESPIGSLGSVERLDGTNVDPAGPLYPAGIDVNGDVWEAHRVDIPGAPGLCGLPYVGRVSGIPAIAGIHFAGRDGRSGVVTLTRKEITMAIQFLDKHRKIPRPELNEAPLVMDSNMLLKRGAGTIVEYDGEVLGCYQLAQMSGSRFVETSIKDKVLRTFPEYSPAPLRDGLYGEQWVSNSLTTACKFLVPKRAISEALRSATKTMFKEYVRQNVSRYTELDLHTAITGIAAEPGYTSLNLATSAGRGFPGKKKDYISRDGTLVEVDERVIEDVNRHWEDLLLPNPPMPLCIATYKDELIKVAKARTGKNRVFQVFALRDIINARRAILDIIAQFTKRPIATGIAIGSNCFSTVWGEIAEYLGPEVWCADAAGWDTSLPFLEDVCSVIVERLEELDVDTRRVAAIFGGLTKFATTARGIGTVVTKGMPSGHPFTAMGNSLCHVFGIMMAYIFFHGTPSTSYADFRRDVRFVVYGDDSVISSDVLTPEEHTATFRNAGIILQREDKTAGEIVKVPIGEASFLKRGFKREGDLWMAPLDLASVGKSLQYWRRGGFTNEREALAVSFGNAAKESVFHSREAHRAIEELATECSFTVESYDSLIEAWKAGTLKSWEDETTI